MRDRFHFIGAALLTEAFTPTPASSIVTYVFGGTTPVFGGVMMRKGVVAALALTMACVSAHADTITQSVTFAPLVGYGSETATPISYFNPALGTLTSATAVFDQTTTFIGGGAGDANEADYRLDFGGLTMLYSATATGNTSVTPIQSFNIPIFALNSFVGTGNFTPAITSFNGNNTSATVLTTFGATNRLIYTYTAATAAVPEPATWVMMIAGFGAIGIAMRRRKVAVRLGCF